TRVDAQSVALFQSLAASYWQIFWKLRLPSAIPSIFSGLKIASSVSFVGAIAGEFSGSQAGIGYLIKSSFYYINVDVAFAAVLATASAGFIVFTAVQSCERYVVFWKF